MFCRKHLDNQIDGLVSKVVHSIHAHFWANDDAKAVSINHLLWRFIPTEATHTHTHTHTTIAFSYLFLSCVGEASNVITLSLTYSCTDLAAGESWESEGRLRTFPLVWSLFGLCLFDGTSMWKKQQFQSSKPVIFFIVTIRHCLCCRSYNVYSYQGEAKITQIWELMIYLLWFMRLANPPDRSPVDLAWGGPITISI